ncbi:hypothetical protein ANCDUO_15528, partial [Ancylostoma duodenale]
LIQLWRNCPVSTVVAITSSVSILFNNFFAAVSDSFHLRSLDEDEDGDRIAVRSDEDLPAFASHLQRDGFATIWLVECTPSDLNDIPAIFPSDLKHLNLISHGQFGSVYRSVHLPTDRVLAVKCISLGEYDEQKDNVLKELALMKKCSPCEYVVSLVGGSVDSQVLYICLEYMDGGSIGGYGALPSNVLKFVSRCIFEGLKYLWTSNIMHRVEWFLLFSSIRSKFKIHMC